MIEGDMITVEDALRNADSVNDLRLRLKLESKSSKSADLLEGTEDLMVEEEAEESHMLGARVSSAK